MGLDYDDIFNGSNAVEKKAEKVTAADGHTYHKSSSANASEAPTNKGTLDQLDEKVAAVGAGLTDHQLDFVMMCQMYYDIYGMLIPVEVAVKRYGITEEIYANTIKQAPVEDALVKNGIVKLEPEGKRLLPKAEVLTPRELIVANTMLDLLDTRSDKKKLQDLGMSTSEYQRLLRKPAFHEYLRDKAESSLQVGQHEAALALLDKVRQGDLKAISYYNEYMGRFSPAAKQSTTVNVGNTSNSDLQWIVTNLVEIITEEVTDANIAARIGDRIKALIGNSRMATEIIQASAEPVKPEVAAMRPTSEVVKAIEARAGINKDGED